MNNIIYLDNAATTKPYEQVVRVIEQYSNRYANPASAYSFAKKVKAEVEYAREYFAETINAKPGEIYFTSGGTEADNWVIKTVPELLTSKGRGILSSRIEHHAVGHSMKYMSDRRFDVNYVNVDKCGQIIIEDYKRKINEKTTLVSIMYANNEIGTILNIQKLANIAHKHGSFFHSDVVQAYAHIPIDVKKDGIDYLSVSSHKFGGPKGIGFLYASKKAPLKSYIHGGSQENSYRAGTLNTIGIIAMQKAAQISFENMKTNIYKQSRMRDYMIDKVVSLIDNTIVNGDVYNRLPNNISFSFKGIDSTKGNIVGLLDQYGICASGGSACSANNSDPSHVLKAIGHTDQLAKSSVRFSLSAATTYNEINYTINALKRIITRLRNE